MNMSGHYDLLCPGHSVSLRSMVRKADLSLRREAPSDTMSTMRSVSLGSYPAIMEHMRARLSNGRGRNGNTIGGLSSGILRPQPEAPGGHALTEQVSL